MGRVSKRNFFALRYYLVPGRPIFYEERSPEEKQEIFLEEFAENRVLEPKHGNSNDIAIAGVREKDGKIFGKIAKEKKEKSFDMVDDPTLRETARRFREDQAVHEDPRWAAHQLRELGERVVNR